MILFLLSLQPLFARILPSYTEELEQRLVLQLGELIEQGSFYKAELLLEYFQREIGESAPLTYEAALLFNKAGRLEDAMMLYTRALQLDPHHRASLYDRAELYLTKEAWELAKQDLLAAIEQESHWILYLRLAEIAAVQHNIFECELQLMRALEHGMRPEKLLDFGERWHVWSHDPQLGLAIKNVLLLDAGEEGVQTWKRLQQPF
jgi:tetratricopeptide (TPR) repeat protein